MSATPPARSANASAPRWPTVQPATTSGAREKSAMLIAGPVRSSRAPRSSAHTQRASRTPSRARPLRIYAMLRNEASLFLPHSGEALPALWGPFRGLWPFLALSGRRRLGSEEECRLGLALEHGHELA